jgi:hypothetical protein
MGGWVGGWMDGLKSCLKECYSNPRNISPCTEKMLIIREFVFLLSISVSRIAAVRNFGYLAIDLELLWLIWLLLLFWCYGLIVNMVFMVCAILICPVKNFHSI